MRPTRGNLNTSLIRAAGKRRRGALNRADEELEAIAAELIRAGTPHGAVTFAEENTGVARSTLYRKIRELEAREKGPAA